MPVSRKRKKKQRTNDRRPTTPASARGISSLADLRDPAAIALLQGIKADDLDSIGLASFYVLCAPAQELNQCALATTILYLARQALGANSEVVPAVLEIPSTGERWGRPDPQFDADGTALDGHVVLVTDKDILLDITAAQFSTLNTRRNGLPIVGRSYELWDELCSPGALQDPGRSSQIVVMDEKSEPICTYMLYSPIRAANVVSQFLAQNDREQIALYLTHFVNDFAWVVANLILTGERQSETNLISNKKFKDKVLNAVGAPAPTSVGRILDRK